MIIACVRQRALVAPWARGDEHRREQCSNFFNNYETSTNKNWWKTPAWPKQRIWRPTTSVIGQWCPRRLETASTQSSGGQLRHCPKKVRQPFGAPVSGVGGTGAPATSTGEDDFDASPVQAWLTQLVKTAQGIKQSASPRGSSRPARKPPVPPKLSITPSAKKKLRFTTPEVSTEELAKELPFSKEPGPELRDTPSDRVTSIKKSIKRNIRKRGCHRMPN